MQLPPPVHGVSVMGEIISKSPLINKSFKCYYLDSGLSRSVKNLQKTSFSKIFSTGLIVLKLIRLLSARRYHKVYLTFFPYGSGFWKDALLIKCCRLFGYKPLLHLHTYGFRKSAESSAFRRKIYKNIFRHSEAICLSEKLTEDIETIYKGKVSILPNGIPAHNQYNNYQLREGALRLLFLSNLIRGKGILIILEALKILKAEKYIVHLLVVGEEFDVTYAQIREIMKQYGIEEQVSLEGAKYGDEKYRVISSSDVLLLPSDYDTFGLVLLEAMQYGVPCIASNVGAMPEVLSQGSGLVMPELTAKYLADCIVFLADHPEERKKISNRAFERFHQNYTSDHFERNLHAILSDKAARTVKFVNA